MLTVHHGGRAEALLDTLVELLSVPPDDPFTAEVVSVPSRGVERWLQQQLSRRLGTSAASSPGSAGGAVHDGISANVEFPFPDRLVHRALGGDPAGDPWDIGPLTWRVLAALRRTDPGTTYLRARQVTDLFDRYAVYRPGLLHQWRAGYDHGTDGRPLDERHVWQSHLWRALAAELGADPAQRLLSSVAELRAGTLDSDLPDRVVVLAFGTLPASQISVLDALGTQHDVHVLLLHPSPGWWRTIEAQARPPFPEPPLPRLAVSSAHPLLTTWGQVAHESQAALCAGAPGARWRAVDDERADPQPRTLLGRLQHDLRAAADPTSSPRLRWTQADRSVQVHAAHGRTRQVEVLRDALAHLLDDREAGLQLRDIVVLCPDLEEYRSVLTSTLGLLPGADGSGAPRFPLSIARSPRTDEPLVEALHAVIRTARGRCTASAVGALATLAPVRRTFGFSDADLASISEWIDAANVRWGLDGDHLAADGIPPEVEVTTWEAALDRLLLGVAMIPAPARLGIGERRPCEAVGLDDAIGLGRLAELLHRLRVIRPLVGTPMRADEWVAALREVADAVLTPDPGQPWEARQLARLFESIEHDLAALPADADVVLSPSEMVSVLRGVDPSRGPSGSWGSGAITVCGLGDLRGVPHEVVCILGLDDDVLRRSTSHPDDLLARNPCVGDREPRTEQRALLLDALLSARRHLLITYSGNDVRTNQPMPPATPLAELLDVIDACSTSLDPGAPADAERTLTSASLVVHHPRQAFAEANLLPGRLGVPGAWSFDRTAKEGAESRRAGSEPPGALHELRLPRAVPDDRPVVLADLVTTLVNPVRTFLDLGLGVRIPRQREERSDLVATKPDPLGAWGLASRLFELSSASDLPIEQIEERWRRLAVADGDLPPGRFAERAAGSTHERIAALTAGLAGSGLPLRCAGTQPIDLLLPSGRRFVGRVADVHGTTVVLTRPGRLRAKELLDAHVRVLAMRASGIDAQGLIAGVTNKQQYDAIRVDLDVGPAAATAALDELIELADLCRSVALPIAVNVAAAWSGMLGSRFRLDNAWDPNDLWDPPTALVFGHLLVSELGRHIPPGEHESGQELSRRLWTLLRGVVV
ncbi:MAG: exodeoxyribonuclease V subunit gamma [Acidimicrobiia bacterium]